MPFFQNIKYFYGNETVFMMKQIIKTSNKLCDLRNRRIFLLRCKSQQIIPKFLNQDLRRFHPLPQEQLLKISKKFAFSIMKLEITDYCKNCKQIVMEVGLPIRQIIEFYSFGYF